MLYTKQKYFNCTTQIISSSTPPSLSSFLESSWSKTLPSTSLDFCPESVTVVKIKRKHKVHPAIIPKLLLELWLDWLSWSSSYEQHQIHHLFVFLSICFVLLLLYIQKILNELVYFLKFSMMSWWDFLTEIRLEPYSSSCMSSLGSAKASLSSSGPCLDSVRTSFSCSLLSSLKECWSGNWAGRK